MAAKTRGSSSYNYDYDVFLSFGKDTGRTFTGHLYAALDRAGIRTFMAGEDLRCGTEIGPQILKTIKESRMSIVVLSENYASSRWCLRELAYIMECKETDRLYVFPICYHVDPFEFQNQRGRFEKAFLELEEELPKETVDRWREALRETARRTRGDIVRPNYSYEAGQIRSIVQKASNFLDKSTTMEPAKRRIAIETRGSSSYNYDYDVFLSFRGEDTRATFTDHLYAALVQDGIRTFEDGDELKGGTEIGTPNLKEIKESRMSIVVLSENYASSRRCLRNLAYIMECKETDGLVVFPIFYHVKLSEVRNQRGGFEKAFLEHEEELPKETVDCWRKALTEAANLKGWDTGHPEIRYEAELIQSIVRTALIELNISTVMEAAKLPIAIDSHVEEVMNLLDDQSAGVQFVGIHGIGGIGKTTIAKEVFNRIFSNFQGWSFLADVRERASQSNGLVNLQNKIVYDISKQADLGIGIDAGGVDAIKKTCCNKKVLIILDDVDHYQQLSALAGGRDWFGSGSRIIITTRDEHILNANQVDESKIYRPKELDENQSLCLFSNHAFRKGQHVQEFWELSEKVVSMARGLPLTLEVLGSFLRDKRTPREWECTLEILNKIPTDEVQRKLLISYNGLNPLHRVMFLDIACFFIGMDVEIVAHILEDYPTRRGIKEPIKKKRGIKDLVLDHPKIDDNDLMRMHDLIRHIEREIIQKRSPKYPTSRGINEPIKKRRGIKDLVLEPLKIDDINLQRMFNIFRVIGREIIRRESSKYPSRRGIEDLVLKSLVKIDDENKLRMHDLLRDMGREIVRQESPKNLGKRSRLWSHGEALDVLRKCKGTSKVQGLLLNFGYESKDRYLRIEAFEPMPKLRLLRVDHADLVGNSDHFPMGLKWLSWKGIPLKIPTISHLEKLVVLDMSRSMISEDWDGWKQIKILKTLKVLDLSSCIYLTRTPNLSSLTNLEKLILDCCVRLIACHESVGDLKKLVLLSLKCCKSLVELPDSICKLSTLERLTLTECKMLYNLPEALGSMKSLTHLIIDDVAIKELPDTIGSLDKLERLSVKRCSKLDKLPESMGKLISLHHFNMEGTGIAKLPENFGMLLSLEELKMAHCREFNSFPENFGNLEHLSILVANNCNLTAGAFPIDFEGLPSLKFLNLCYNRFCSLPASFSRLSLLQTLDLHCCTELQSLPELPSGLIELNTRECTSLEVLPDLSNLKILKELCLQGCEKLVEIRGINLSQLKKLPVGFCTQLKTLPALPSSLIELDASGCSSMESLPDLSKLKNLQALHLCYCMKLSKIQGIGGLFLLQKLELENCRMLRCLLDLPRGLIRLDIRNCISMERLPNLSNLGKLKELYLDSCENLTEIRGLKNLDSLIDLRARGCHTYIKTLSKSVAQGVLPSAVDKEDIRMLFLVPDNDNINATILYLVYQLLQPIGEIEFCIEVDIRKNDGKNIRCCHSQRIEGMIANEDQFYSCYFEGRTWFGLPLEEGDKIELESFNFYPEQGVTLKILDFSMEDEAMTHGKQLKNN